MIGSTLSHFHITAKLGEGGMGEVYRADDTKLEREVALKVLPEAVAQDPERLARFEREAKVLATLNHPHIAAIYQVEEADGVHFLVMELAEGEDLAARIARGRMPARDALPIALQIAEALEAAHEKGVIHRDLKPANVKVSVEGAVKVLDFGLAKALAPGEGANSGTVPHFASQNEGLSPNLPRPPTALSLSPTLTAQMTQAGVLLGTAAYMSPEQARGQIADKRSDIWAFGVVLYEMLSGRKLFEGDTVTDVLAAIVRADLEIERLPPNSPAPIRRLIERCLDRESRTRLRDIGEARIVLSRCLASPDLSDGATEPSEVSSRSGIWQGLAAVFALAAFGFGFLWLSGRQDKTSGQSLAPRVSGMSLITDLPGEQTAPSLSPDGNQLLYVSDDDGDKDIFLLRVGGQNAVNLTADWDSNDNHPAWSPDGQRIAFDSDREQGGIFVMGATGESPLRVSDEGFHPVWSPDSSRLVYCDESVVEVYSRASWSRLTVLDLSTRERQELSETGDAVQGQWSPDGQWLAYWTADNGQRDIRIVPASGNEPYTAITDDVPADWSPVWSPDGRWLYFLSDRGGSPDLWRVPVDPSTGQATGPLESVTTGVADVMSVSMASETQAIAIGIENKSSVIERYGFDLDNERLSGSPQTVFFSNNEVVQTDITVDGKWLAFRSTAPQDDLITMQVDGSSRRRLTNDVGRDRGPTWSPDGEWLAFYSNREGSYDHFLIRKDGAGLRRLTNHPESDVNDIFWSHDGTRIATLVFQPLGTAIYPVDPTWLDASASIEPIRLEVREDVAVTGGWSPDDRYLLAYADVFTNQQALGVLEVESGEFRAFDFPRGIAFQLWWDPAWLDDRHVIFWERNLAAAFVADVETGQVHKIPDIPGPTGFEVADGGRTLYLNRRILEADIWMLRLGDSQQP